MKLIKYFLITILGVWTGIILIMSYQNRNKNKTYQKIKSWIQKEETKSHFKEDLGIDL